MSEIKWATSKPENRPQTREGAAFCETKDSLYIFGGVLFDERIQEPIELNDLWKFNFSDERFEKIECKTGPAVRSSCSITWSETSNKIYLFGGITNISGWLKDLWEFDIESGEWSEIISDQLPPFESEVNVPCNRNMTSLNAVNYGKSDKEGLFLFGGFGPEPPKSGPFPGETENDDWVDDDELEDVKKEQEGLNLVRFNDCYIFDVETKTWMVICPEHSIPDERCAHKTVYDQKNRKIWLFGGKGATSRLSDTISFDTRSLNWEYHSENVSKITPRSFHEMTFDEGKVYIHGGRDDFNKHLGDVIQIHPEYKVFETDIKIGNHMMFSIRNEKVYIYGGTSEFNAEYGCCDKFHDHLHIGDISGSGVKKLKVENGSENGIESHTEEPKVISPTKEVRENLENSKIDVKNE